MVEAQDCKAIAEDLALRTLQNLTKEKAALNALQEQERQLEDAFKALGGEGAPPD